MTDTQNLPADWAIEEALKRGRGDPRDLPFIKREPDLYSVSIAFARMIEKHEQPPVDPDVEAVKRIIRVWEGWHYNEPVYDCEEISRAVTQYKIEVEKRS